MENRHGLAVQTELTEATGTAEREAAVTMITAQAPAGGVGSLCSKNYDTQGCVAQSCAMPASPRTWRRTRVGAEAAPFETWTYHAAPG